MPKTRSAQGQKTLPREYYTNAEIYQVEIERIFMQHWLYAGRAAALAKPGDYFLFEIDNESLILLRDRQGRRHAFHNLCRHRGTRLCEQPAGTFAHRIQCLYHAWTYDLEGRLIGAPNMQEVADFDRAQYPLLSASIAEWEGGLFINLASQPQPFEHWFAPLIDKFRRWRMAEMVAVHRLVYEVEANWKLIFQNYSECYHCPSLHPMLNRLTSFRNSSNDLEEGPFLGGPMRLSNEGGSMTVSGARCAPPLGGLSADDLSCVYYYTIFPSLLLSLHPDYVLVHQLQPQNPTRTRITCEWLFHPQAVSLPDFDPSGAIEFWNTTNLQDWHVSEMSQKGINSRMYTPGPYAALESITAAFDREYLKCLGHMPSLPSGN